MAAQTRSTRVPAWVPFFNPIARRLLAAGVPLGPDVLLTVHGRTSGLPRSTPVAICAYAGRRAQPAGGWPRHHHGWPAERRSEGGRAGTNGGSGIHS